MKGEISYAKNLYCTCECRNRAVHFEKIEFRIKKNCANFLVLKFSQKSFWLRKSVFLLIVFKLFYKRHSDLKDFLRVILLIFLLYNTIFAYYIEKIHGVRKYEIYFEC